MIADPLKTFLIEYERGRLVTLQTFTDRQSAEDARLELDIKHRGTKREIVLLEAASEEALRRTHGRYFDDITGIIGRLWWQNDYKS